MTDLWRREREANERVRHALNRAAFRSFMDRTCHRAAVNAALEACAEAYETPLPTELVRIDDAITVRPDA
jgi:hypothetical protein